MVRFDGWVGRLVGVDTAVDVYVAVAVTVYVEVAVAVIVDVAEGVDVFVEVSVPVGVIEAVWVKVGETGMMTTVDVAVGMNWGVGERIAGRGDGHATGVAIARGMYPPLQDASKRINTVARIILVILFLQSLSFYRKFQ